MNHPTKSLISLLTIACIAATLQAGCSSGSCRSQEYRNYRSPEYRNDHCYKEVLEETSAATDKPEDYSFYGRGQRIGCSMIRAFALLARGDAKSSTRMKDSVFKKHVNNLSKIKKNLDLPWFFWGSEPLKTEEQKQAFQDARNYYKGIGEKLKSFDFVAYLQKHNVEEQRAQKLIKAYDFIAQGCLDLAAINEIEPAYTKWKELDKDLSKVIKNVWS